MEESEREHVGLSNLGHSQTSRHNVTQSNRSSTTQTLGHSITATTDNNENNNTFQTVWTHLRTCFSTLSRHASLLVNYVCREARKSEQLRFLVAKLTRKGTLLTIFMALIFLSLFFVLFDLQRVPTVPEPRPIIIHVPVPVTIAINKSVPTQTELPRYKRFRNKINYLNSLLQKDKEHNQTATNRSSFQVHANASESELQQRSQGNSSKTEKHPGSQQKRSQGNTSEVAEKQTDPVQKYPFNSFLVSDKEPHDKFSIIMLVYNRTNFLLRLLNHYAAMTDLDLIVVVWNNNETAPPLEQWIALGPHPVGVAFKVQSENKLRNRLQNFPEIKTAAVFLVDDDLGVSAKDLQFAFRVWKHFPYLIVGFVARKHILSPSTGRYSYGSDELDSNTLLGNFAYSLILTGAAFTHKTYLQMFNDRSVVPESVSTLIDTLNNCEDIAVNVMVGAYLKKVYQPQCAGVFVKATKMMNLENEAGLWHDPYHLAERSHCLNTLATIYNGSLPLYYSDMKLTSVQDIPARIC